MKNIIILFIAILFIECTPPYRHVEINNISKIQKHVLKINDQHIAKYDIKIRSDLNDSFWIRATFDDLDINDRKSFRKGYNHEFEGNVDTIVSGDYYNSKMNIYYIPSQNVSSGTIEISAAIY